MGDGYSRWLLSGGIGSGKSAVRGILESHGIDTIDADSVGHEVLAGAGPAVSEVAATWPQVVDGGRIDRAKLGAMVFASAEELRRLESITHPHISALISERVEELSPPVVVEIPVMGIRLEGDWARIVVDADRDSRLERCLARGMTREDALRRMDNQPSRAEWLAAADLILPNMGDMAELESTVEAALGFIRG